MERIAESREASSVAASASTARRDATACECHLKTRPRSQRIFSALVFGERSVRPEPKSKNRRGGQRESSADPNSTD